MSYITWYGWDIEIRNFCMVQLLDKQCLHFFKNDTDIKETHSFIQQFASQPEVSLSNVSNLKLGYMHMIFGISDSLRKHETM